MKFNWGHGIFIAIVLGITGFLTLVYITTNQQIDMVTDEYYPKELKYQEQIAKEVNYNALAERIQIENDDSLKFNFPRLTNEAKEISGTIHLYRPSDKRLDIETDLTLDTAFCMIIDKALLRSGKYQVIVDWEANGVEYLSKLPLYID